MILIGSIATFHTEIANLFGQTLNSEKGEASITARPYSTLVDPNAVVNNFNDDYTRKILDQMEMKCMGSSGVCIQTSKGDGIETSGAVGTKKFLDKQMRRIMMAFDDLLDKPGNESLKAKFRELANISYELAELQRQLARAIQKGDKAKIAALIAQINGGSVTYRVDNGDGTYTMTTITGDQSGSVVDQLRQLRNEIMNDPRLASIGGGADALDALYSILEFDALSASTLVNGPPPSGGGATLADAVKNGNGDTSGTGAVVQQTTTDGVDAKTKNNINDVIKLVNSDPALANELLSLATKEASVKNTVNTASSAYGKDSDEAAAIINKAAKTLASDPNFASASPAEQEKMLEDVLKDMEKSRERDGIDNDVAEDLRDDVKDGGSITSVMLEAAKLEAEKKALSTKINNTLVSNSEKTSETVVDKVVDTATSDTTVANDMTSGNTTAVTQAVEEKAATDAATEETAAAAETTEESANKSCSVGDGTTQAGAGASSCIG